MSCNKPCLSCEIVSGRQSVRGGTIVETEYFHAHQDVAYPVPGQVIVAAKRHFRHLDEMSKQETDQLLPLLKKIRAAQRQTLSVEHVYYFYNEDTKHHFHVWMVPRYDWMKQFGKSIESVRPALLYARDHMNSRLQQEDVAHASERLHCALLADSAKSKPP